MTIALLFLVFSIMASSPPLPQQGYPISPLAGGRVSSPALMAQRPVHHNPRLQSQIHCAAQSTCLTYSLKCYSRRGGKSALQLLHPVPSPLGPDLLCFQAGYKAHSLDCYSQWGVMARTPTLRLSDQLSPLPQVGSRRGWSTTSAPMTPHGRASSPYSDPWVLFCTSLTCVKIIVLTR